MHLISAHHYTAFAHRICECRIAQEPYPNIRYTACGLVGLVVSLVRPGRGLKLPRMCSSTQRERNAKVRMTSRKSVCNLNSEQQSSFETHIAKIS